MRAPRDPRQLLVEMDARIKVRDIREWDRLRRQVEVRWWESGLLAVLFISGVGMIITISNVVPADNPLLRRFIIGWCALFIVTLVFCVEFLISKFRALRRMNEEATRRMADIEASLKAIRDYLEAVEDARPDATPQRNRE